MSRLVLIILSIFLLPVEVFLKRGIMPALWVVTKDKS